MHTADIIQTGILFATLLGVVVALFFGVDQVKKQNRMLRAQLVKDIFDMYQSAGRSISDEFVKHFEQYHFEYMDSELFQKRYRGNSDKIRKYVWVSEHYEMLAFAFSIRDMLKDQIINEKWMKMWLRDLKQHAVFDDVSATYGKYYREFDRLVSTITPDCTLHEAIGKKGKKA